MANRFDPKGGTPDAMNHPVTRGTLGGNNNSARANGLPKAGGEGGLGELTNGNSMKAGKKTGSSKGEGHLGASRGPGFAVVTK
jgi:hypothetical protein